MKFKVFHCSWESFIYTRVIKLIESLRLKLYLNTYDGCWTACMFQRDNKWRRIYIYVWCANENDKMIRVCWSRFLTKSTCGSFLSPCYHLFQPYPRLVTKELKHGHETSGAMNPAVEVTRGVVTTPILVLRPASGNRSMKPYVIERLFDSLCLVGIVERERTCNSSTLLHPRGGL